MDKNASTGPFILG